MIDRVAVIRSHGRDPIACSTLQNGLAYFDTSYGFIAYRRVLGMDITLGPPVCAPADRAPMIDRFVHSRRRPIRSPVSPERRSRPLASIATGRGLSTNAV